MARIRLLLAAGASPFRSFEVDVVSTDRGGSDNLQRGVHPLEEVRVQLIEGVNQ